MGIELQKKLGKRIQELRKGKGLSQESFAELLDIATNTLSNIERGRAFMTAGTLEKIIDILKVKPQDLFTFPEDEQNVYDELMRKIERLKDDTHSLSLMSRIMNEIV